MSIRFFFFPGEHNDNREFLTGITAAFVTLRFVLSAQFPLRSGHFCSRAPAENASYAFIGQSNEHLLPKIVFSLS
jgi:hypothetical protein